MLLCCVVVFFFLYVNFIVQWDEWNVGAERLKSLIWGATESYTYGSPKIYNSWYRIVLNANRFSCIWNEKKKNVSQKHNWIVFDLILSYVYNLLIVEKVIIWSRPPQVKSLCKCFVIVCVHFIVYRVVHHMHKYIAKKKIFFFIHFKFCLIW